MRPATWILAALALVSPARAVEIVAHRGASHDAPENTLAAQLLAWEQGADLVETDVHLTRDGELIVIHDKTTPRTTGRPGVVAELTLAELRSYDAGSWKDPRFRGERLPTLDEQLTRIPAGKRMLVELKIGPEIVPALARSLARCGATPATVTLISFNAATLREVRRALPAYRTLYLMGYKAPAPGDPKAKAPPRIEEVIAEALAAGFSGLDLQHTWPLTSDEVARIRAAGLELHVWTVDDLAVARRWINLGVASITTNRPGWLRAELVR
ncbi:MAG: Glycerophosphoryl diester phosphodiesterase [Verrucomicrobiota bacterium]|jgi:glycerophosphoryl diester phosphodiesterase